MIKYLQLLWFVGTHWEGCHALLLDPCSGEKSHSAKNRVETDVSLLPNMVHVDVKDFHGCHNENSYMGYGVVRGESYMYQQAATVELRNGCSVIESTQSLVKDTTYNIKQDS
jgi:hypothetical protein